MVSFWILNTYTIRTVESTPDSDNAYKTVSQDLVFLSRLGLVALKEPRRVVPVAPTLPYDEIELMRTSVSGSRVSPFPVTEPGPVVLLVQEVEEEYDIPPDQSIPRSVRRD